MEGSAGLKVGRLQGAKVAASEPVTLRDLREAEAQLELLKAQAPWELVSQLKHERLYTELDNLAWTMAEQVKGKLERECALKGIPILWPPQEKPGELRLIAPSGQHWGEAEGGSHEKRFADNPLGRARALLWLELAAEPAECSPSNPCQDLEEDDEGDHISGRLMVARCNYATGDKQA